ncbi:MAG: FumA C-terminus/TtdB family hydratase beta subunit [Methanophagales archaeon]|nr:FumA C-terminus/TtdB family hydratase beta subunit [Methanophagales archaeon]PXF51456.1 MAG: fumarate hydratase [Methanophagales archaeon]
MTKKKLHTPLEESEIKQLRLGEVVSLSGEIYTARDRAHQRILKYSREKHEKGTERGKERERGKKIPIKKGAVIYHCGPLVRMREGKVGEGEILAAGPTTSARMDAATPEVIEKLGIRAVIGKGGMGVSTREAMRKYGCVYLAMTGGAGVLAATRIKTVKAVYWEDLGIAEAVWHLLVEDFGPLVVSIDVRGNSLYEKINYA